MPAPVSEVRHQYPALAAGQQGLSLQLPAAGRLEESQLAGLPSRDGELAINEYNGLLVDLYLMPAYGDLASLYLADGQWTIHYPLPTDTQQTEFEAEAKSLPLSEATLNQVLDSIAAHAEAPI